MDPTDIDFIWGKNIWEGNSPRMLHWNPRIWKISSNVFACFSYKVESSAPSAWIKGWTNYVKSKAAGYIFTTEIDRKMLTRLLSLLKYCIYPMGQPAIEEIEFFWSEV